ncbi:MAG TPA: glycosyltransferase family 2 protein [Acidimicrobiales bacterium]|nr:glycosyltransferase family 2 protein [Acidimicrobiales bacterium]
MERVAAVVVDYHAGEALGACVDSLRENGVSEVVVVENGATGTAQAALAGRGARLVEPGVNLGYGRGANRGAAEAPPSRYLLISNPDLVVHPGAVAALCGHLDDHPDVGVAGPRIERPDGSTYPSHRVFPNVWLAGAHALLGSWWPGNPATVAYRSARPDGGVDWVSGAFMLFRREAFDAVGGFDERYFMFAEEMAICWALGRAGWRVAAVEGAVVTHVEGLSREREPRRMLVAHHASALRFEWQTASGARRLLFPLAALVVGVRLVASLVVGRWA